jgi:uncharacterized protein
MKVYFHMVIREFWLEKLDKAWKEKSVIWLSGVRRAGKTTLAKSLSRSNYFDCELPRVRRLMDDPESFLESYSGKTIILDEVHRLDNPSELLKIAADHYPDTKILATGSSTLGASKKFRDSLTDRKINVWLTPMNKSDLSAFKSQGLKHRFLRGGLPPFYLSEKYPENRFQDWMDSYWAKDIQELFHLERKQPFQKFFELLLCQSGGLFEASSFSAPCGVTHPTILNYLSVLESTYVAHVIRPFNKGKAKEITSAPKVYGFDSGFIAYYKGWNSLRPTDYGELWEHFVLNEMHGEIPRNRILYWRDKAKHEIDFIYQPRGKDPIAIECKWDAEAFKIKNFKAFSSLYPDSKKIVVAHNINDAYRREIQGMDIEFIPLHELKGTLIKS